MSPAGWTALAACVGVVIAAVAGLVAWRQLHEARQLRLAQAQPYVVVFTDNTGGGDPRHVDLVIKNFGTTAATDVRVKFSAPLDSAVLRERSPIKTPDVIPLLVPGQEWRTFWDFTPQRDAASDLPRSYTATVSFKDSTGETQYPTYTFVLDWQALMDRGFVTVYTEHDAAKALRDISMVLNGAAAFGGAINIVTRDGDAKDQREAEYWAERQAADKDETN